MKKALSLFILPLLAGVVICVALHTFIPFSGLVGPDYLSQSGTSFTFGLMGFLFGFLPCFIRGLALSTLAAMRPQQAPASDPVNTVMPLFVGQEFTSNGANCRIRVKALKVRNILEYNNDLLADYL